MEKIEITILPKKPVSFDYGTMTNIMVVPYISIDNKRKIDSYWEGGISLYPGFIVFS